MSDGLQPGIYYTNGEGTVEFCVCADVEHNDADPASLVGKQFFGEVAAGYQNSIVEAAFKKMTSAGKGLYCFDLRRIPELPENKFLLSMLRTTNDHRYQIFLQRV
jgi:hypothetical protein